MFKADCHLLSAPWGGAPSLQASVFWPGAPFHPSRFHPGQGHASPPRTPTLADPTRDPRSPLQFRLQSRLPAAGRGGESRSSPSAGLALCSAGAHLAWQPAPRGGSPAPTPRPVRPHCFILSLLRPATGVHVTSTASTFKPLKFKNVSPQV